MNSIKNLFVVILLMGVSYGAFQVINAPDPSLTSNEAETEALDIQIGPRTDEPDVFTTPPLATRQPSTGPATPPTLPPLLPNAARGAAETGSAPAANPEMPNIDIAGSGTVSDPVALTNAQPAAGDFQTPPPLAPADHAHSQPLQPIPHSSVAQYGGGRFNPSPQTKLEPVSPKPAATFSPPPAAASQFAGSDPAGNPSGNQALLEPSRDASSMLQRNPDNLAARAEAMIGNPADRNRTSSEAGPEAGQTASLAATSPGQIDWEGINAMAGSGKPREALQRLSAHFDASLPQDQRLQMLEWLDILAGKVIYSTEHHLQPGPYVVRQGDTLEMLASQWKVPAQLIYNVNREKIADPALLVPGTELKIIEGPFNAMVSLQRQELALFLKGMYAGRFPIELGQDGNGITHGQFAVREKRAGKDYQDPSGQTFVAGTVNNPYGRFWIGLDEGMGIHEFTPRPGQQDKRGSIRLGSRDAADVYGILSNGSQITIMR